MSPTLKILSIKQYTLLKNWYDDDLELQIFIDKKYMNGKVG